MPGQARARMALTHRHIAPELTSRNFYSYILYTKGVGPKMWELEEKGAHLTRTVEELSDVVARQDTRIAMLNRRVQLLLEREAERESLEGGQTVLADRPPPHY